jgi:hypothetical protein
MNSVVLGFVIDRRSATPRPRSLLCKVLPWAVDEALDESAFTSLLAQAGLVS